MGIMGSGMIVQGERRLGDDQDYQAVQIFQGKGYGHVSSRSVGHLGEARRRETLNHTKSKSIGTAKFLITAHLKRWNQGRPRSDHSAGPLV